MIILLFEQTTVSMSAKYRTKLCFKCQLIFERNCRVGLMVNMKMLFTVIAKKKSSRQQPNVYVNPKELNLDPQSKSDFFARLLNQLNHKLQKIH